MKQLSTISEQIQANLISLLSIFIVVGIGVDDMIVMVDAFDLTPSSLPVDQRLADSMKISAVGIALTSVTDLVAFLISANTGVPAVAYVFWNIYIVH